MSALALSALGLAARAGQGEPALFADLPRRSISGELACIDSSGFAAYGLGAGRYIADGLCTADLLARHPRFVFRTANGRIFRLLAEAGAIAVEQGGARGSGTQDGGTVDDRPAVQAAIDYAEAAGIGEVRFEQARYRIDCPRRTSPASEKFAEDGHPIAVRASLVLRGAAAERTVLDFRAQGGGDPETEWQTIPAAPHDGTPVVWRGGGLFVRGDLADPAPAPRTVARLELDRLILAGNRRNTGNHAFPADPATGDGWDVTDKALWVQDSFVGEIVCRDTDMIGWKGEIVYLAGESNAVKRLELERCTIATSNGSALNPSVDCEILARDCRFGDCFQAQEDIAKTRATYDNCSWFDCDHMALGSGPCDGTLYNRAWPTRDPDAPPPQTLLRNCEFRNIRALSFTSWVSGNIRTIDTTVHLDGNAAMALRDTDLRIEAWLDRKGGLHSLAFTGVASLAEAVPGAPADIVKLPPSQIGLQVVHRRTRLAQDNGREWLGCYWSGYIHRSCALQVTGDVACGRLPNGGATPLSMPRVTYDHGETTSLNWPRGWYRLPYMTGSGEVVPTAPLMTLELTSDSVADIVLARTPRGGADYGYADGQRIRIVRQWATGTMRFVKGGHDGTVVLATRVLAGPYDWIEFTYNRDWQRWEESGFFSAA